MRVNELGRVQSHHCAKRGAVGGEGPPDGCFTEYTSVSTCTRALSSLSTRNHTTNPFFACVRKCGWIETPYRVVHANK